MDGCRVLTGCFRGCGLKQNEYDEEQPGAVKRHQGCVALCESKPLIILSLPATYGG